AVRVTVEASQSGNEVWLAAEPVRRSFTLLPQVGPTVLLSTGVLCQGSVIRARIEGELGEEVNLRLVVSDSRGEFGAMEGFVDARREGNVLTSVGTYHLPVGSYRVRIDVQTAEGEVIEGIPSTGSFQLVAPSQLLVVDKVMSARGTLVLRSPMSSGNTWRRNGVVIGSGQEVEASLPG
ncbi:MAG: hypothetical protein NZM39_12460, partial [Bernardetiaceae bacterium]|nr:hypothetical protein [Bernardetiaceae bacterium]